MVRGKTSSLPICTVAIAPRGDEFLNFVPDKRACRGEKSKMPKMIFYCHMVKVKSAYEPSGPSGRSLPEVPWHGATGSIGSIFSPPWMGC